VKIVQLITELRPAGAERIVLELAAGLKRRGHEVAVVSLRPLPSAPAESGIVERLRALAIPVRSLGVTRAAPWRAARLRRELRGLAPDVVHAHLFHANLVSRLFRAPRPCRLVNTVHIAERRRGRSWQFWLDRLTLSRCDAQTAVSRAVAAYHSRRLGVAAGRLSVVYNGVPPPPRLRRDEICELRKTWRFEAAVKVIGSVGRLDWQKGYDRLMALLPALSQRIPPGETWGVVILGEGPQRECLEPLAAAAPRNLLVRLPGFRPDAAACIGAFDLFVMPSRYEGFGLTLAEAMAHGVPAVTSLADSLPELLEAYPNGEAVPCDPARPEPFVEACLRGLARGPCPGVTPFDLDAMLDGYERVYAGR